MLVESFSSPEKHSGKCFWMRSESGWRIRPCRRMRWPRRSNSRMARTRTRRALPARTRRKSSEPKIDLLFLFFVCSSQINNKYSLYLFLFFFSFFLSKFLNCFLQFFFNLSLIFIINKPMLDLMNSHIIIQHVFHFCFYFNGWDVTLMLHWFQLEIYNNPLFHNYYLT